MESPTKGSVVLVPFPFSDLSQSKLRPALVLASAPFDDFVLCQITSNPYSDPLAIPLETKDFKNGSLRIQSYIRPTKIFTAHKTLLQAEVGLLKKSKISKIIRIINKFLRS